MKVFIIIVVSIVILYFLIRSLSSNSDEIKKINAFKNLTEEERTDMFGKMVNDVVSDRKVEIVEFLQNYIKPLAIKLDQLTYVDDYGDEIFDDWFQERDNFFQNKMYIIYNKLVEEVENRTHMIYNYDDYKASIRNHMMDYSKSIINSEINSILSEELHKYYDDKLNNGENSNFTYNLDDPFLFEKSVAKDFEYLGWQSAETKATGDQGADVIAKKNDITCIVQCKLYSSPVGNKAVQEVYSANKFYHGDYAIVVTNNEYTKSAKALASSLGVTLLHYSQVEDFILKLED
jgi:restriction system protein